MKTWWLKKVATMLALTAAMILVVGSVVMLLWNAIVPDVFGGPTLTYLQAVGLLLLAQILVRGGGRWTSYRPHGGHSHWKQKLEAKLAAMAPEERERFKAEWERRCGCGGEHKGEHQKLD